MSSYSKNVERFDFRLPAQTKQLISCAAAVRGVSQSAFALSALTEAATEALREADTIRVSQKDRVRFCRILDDRSKPNANLVRAARKYRDRIIARG